MNIAAEKISLIERIAHTQDLNLLYEVKRILGITNNPVIGYDIDGNPITKNSLNKSLREVKKRYKAGKFTSQEDLEKETEKW